MARATAGPERYPVFQDGQVSDYRLAKQAYETAAKAGRLAEEAERVATGARAMAEQKAGSRRGRGLAEMRATKRSPSRAPRTPY